MNGCCDGHMCTRTYGRYDVIETPEQRQKARACKCVTACRWRGLASMPDWHAGGVQLSGSAAIFLLQPSDKQVPLNHVSSIQAFSSNDARL